MKSTQFLSTIKSFNRTPRTPLGERTLASLFPSRGTGWPGGWSHDRMEQVLHLRNWNYVFSHLICCKIASLMPNTCYVHDAPVPGLTTKACQRGLMNLYGRGFGGSPVIDASNSYYHPSVGFGGTSDSFLTVGEWHSKALSVVKPHEELEPLEGNHWLRRLLENPNSVDTFFDLMYEKQMFEELCGIWYIWKVPNKWGKTCELWVIPSHWVWPRTGGERVPDGGARDRMRRNGWTTYEYEPEQQGGDYARYGAKWVDIDNPYRDRLIQYYEVRPWGGFGSAGVLRLPPNEVMCGRWKSPINKIDGYGTLAAIAQWIDMEESMSKSAWSQFMNQARPDFWVELGPGYEDPDDDRIARLESKWINKLGGELNYGKPYFSPNGTKVTPLSFTPTQMAYEGSMEKVRDMIGAAKGVPKSAVGLTENMTYGSVLATLMGLCSYSLNPRLTKSGQDITKHLASEWDEKPSERAWSNGYSRPAGPSADKTGISDDAGTQPIVRYMTRGNGGSGQRYGRRVRLWWDDCVPADPSQINSDIETDLHAYAITPNELRALRGRKPYRKGGDNPLVSGPAGIMPLAINAEEENVDDIAKVIQELGKASQQGQGGGQQPGTPGEEPGAQQDQRQQLPNEEQSQGKQPDGKQGDQILRDNLPDVSDMSEDTEGIQEPNNKPSKRLVSLAKAFLLAKIESHNGAAHK